MTDNTQVKKLKQENDELKTQINDLQEELKEIKRKVEAVGTGSELQHSVEHVSAEYDDLKSSTAAVVRDLKKIEERLAEISQKVYDVEDAVESIMAYSYQYNIKIMGIPQVKDSELAEETVEICLKLFKELKANVNEYDIDIAHRLQNRSIGLKPAAIICKFTRRVAKQSVMSRRKDVKDVNIQNIVSCRESDSSTISIFDHLTPKKQQLLNQAKDTQRELGYAYCWVKNNENSHEGKPEQQNHKDQ